MSLADRLNSALANKRLTPIAVSEVSEEAPKPKPKPAVKESKPAKKTVAAYKTLKEGLKSAHNHSPDEFGTTVIVVENIGDKIQLPMKAGKYIVDDIQKRNDGRYEVHLVSGQR